MKRNAIILAAGISSRFVPLSAEIPKGLLEVKGEILIERQISQLQDSGIEDITIVTGYKSEKFEYLRERFNVGLIYNEDYQRYNNTSSIIRVLDKLNNTFICSSDNYFPLNIFKDSPLESFYCALYASGATSEYSLSTDSSDYIRNVSIGGQDSWYMIGPAYFSQEFSTIFKEILQKEYHKENVRKSYWEDVYVRHIKALPKMKIRRCDDHEIEEFDSLDDLRKFDMTYISDTRSSVVKDLARKLSCEESSLSRFKNIPHEGSYLLFSFLKNGEEYEYNEYSGQVKPL
ncbi:MAG: NTP transferase domain-containing protein [Prevotella sp.]|nr:NTP transferase domain-containing protein [Prevotella sp.]